MDAQQSSPPPVNQQQTNQSQTSQQVSQQDDGVLAQAVVTQVQKDLQEEQSQQPARAKERNGGGQQSVDTFSADVVSTPDAQISLDAQTSPDQLQESSPTHESGTESGTAETAESDAAVQEALTAAQSIEFEPQPEIPPEVESYMEQVDRHEFEPPQEVVVADDTAAAHSCCVAHSRDGDLRCNN